MIRHPISCKVGSAWHSWQIRALDWLDRNPNASLSEISKEAHTFASDTIGLGPHSAAYGAKHRAFTEMVVQIIEAANEHEHTEAHDNMKSLYEGASQ